MTEVSDLVEQLSARTLAVCRHYLPNGQRVGNYWVVGDARNTPGRSTFVRLFQDHSGKPAGRWTDAATGEYGDLLDIIRMAVPTGRFADAVTEAEAFLGRGAISSPQRFQRSRPPRRDPVRHARSLYNTAEPLRGTLAETYLQSRAINPALAPSLRFMPDCYCRTGPDSDQDRWPAIIAPVTDDHGALTGVHRLYLDPLGASDGRHGKAPFEKPKRSLGRIFGHAVRFGAPTPTLAVAEGIENALSIRTAIPTLTSHATLSAANLAIYRPPAFVKYLLIAVDDDDKGWWAAETLADRCRLADLSITILTPRYEDHNRDLRSLGIDDYRAALLEQLRPSHKLHGDPIQRS